MSEDEQLDELSTSKRILERELGCTICSIAYPFGWDSAYSDITKRHAKAVGYRLAFSARNGVNRPGIWDQFGLCRLGVSFSDTAALLRARMVCYTSFGASAL